MKTVFLKTGGANLKVEKSTAFENFRAKRSGVLRVLAELLPSCVVGINDKISSAVKAVRGRTALQRSCGPKPLTQFAFGALLLASALPLCAQVPAPPPPISGPNPALMPGNRRTVTLAPNEVNPFGQQAEAVVDTGLEQQESEEVILRRAIGNIPVGGLSGGEGNFNVLLGGMRLRTGSRLPPILPRQTESLEVVAITEKVIILGFLEQDGKVGDRTFAIQLNTRPVVRYLLPSQTSPPPPGESPFQGVYVPPRTDETQ